MFGGELFSGLFLGWSLGSNDAANVFGTAVASRVITFRRASIISAAAIIAGAFFQGHHGIATYSSLINVSLAAITIISLSAGVTVLAMTLLKLPVSTSQAVVGSITGASLVCGNMNWHLLIKIMICWLATPLGAMAMSCLLYLLVRFLLRVIPMSILTRDKLLWTGLILVVVYGSYALGANNTANATGIFSGQFSGLTDTHLALLGGISIAAGVLTFSKGVMYTVGSGILPLDSFTAFVAVSSMSVTVHIFAIVGVPVSTSQGIIGAILGIGLIQGCPSIHFRKFGKIAFGWLLTPLIALILSAACYGIFIR